MEYNIRVYKPELKQEEGKINNLKGFATITFDEAFCVKSLAIKESSKGNLYLDMPRYRDYETGEYVPFFRFTDKEFQKEVLDTVREAYENMTETKTDCKGSWGEEELYYNLSVNPVQGSDTFKADVAIRLAGRIGNSAASCDPGMERKNFCRYASEKFCKRREGGHCPCSQCRI